MVVLPIISTIAVALALAPNAGPNAGPVADLDKGVSPSAGTSTGTPVSPTNIAPIDPSAPRSIINPGLNTGSKRPEATTPPASLTTQLIPTPGAVGLLGLGLLAMSRRKRG